MIWLSSADRCVGRPQGRKREGWRSHRREGSPYGLGPTTKPGSSSVIDQWRTVGPECDRVENAQPASHRVGTVHVAPDLDTLQTVSGETSGPSESLDRLAPDEMLSPKPASHFH